MTLSLTVDDSQKRGGIGAPRTSSRHFKDDAARYAWIIEEFSHRCSTEKSQINHAGLARLHARGMIARDISAFAFGISISELLASTHGGRGNPKRSTASQKIACIISLMTDARLSQVARLLNRDHSTIKYYHHKRMPEVSPFFTEVR